MELTSNDSRMQSLCESGGGAVLIRRRGEPRRKKKVENPFKQKVEQIQCEETDLSM